MRYSSCFIPTVKEDPRDAEVRSHVLMVRAGMIRKVTSGVYTYLPLAVRVMAKISAIVRREMDCRMAQEITMPLLAPAELWQESGRWDLYGRELVRVKDRHDRDFVLGPTHEEVVTDLVRRELASYKQLPINLYQIQTKVRDEIRPRFGLMRGREFVMKDGYSFDKDAAGAAKSYQLMREGYQAIFDRLGLEYAVVEADSGAIGGSFSHEFMVLAASGEDRVINCTRCDYVANSERAASRQSGARSDYAVESGPVEQVHTPAQKTIEEVSAFLNTTPSHCLKVVAYLADGKPVMALVRGEFTINEVKLKNALNCATLELADEQSIKVAFGSVPGYLGPVGVAAAVVVVADNSVYADRALVSGANQADFHLVNVLPGRDFEPQFIADIRDVNAGEGCPRCSGLLEVARGIEVGHIFKLGTKYSESMNAQFLDENGVAQFPVMGCYGIGVSRTMAAAIEQNNDANGIVWPKAIAPFAVLITRIGGSDTVVAAADSLYKELSAAAIETLYDDRNERAGVKFKDADLIGIPVRVTVGSRGVAAGYLSVRLRCSGQELDVPLPEVAQKVAALLQSDEVI